VAGGSIRGECRFQIGIDFICILCGNNRFRVAVVRFWVAEMFVPSFLRRVTSAAIAVEINGRLSSQFGRPNSGCVHSPEPREVGGDSITDDLSRFKKTCSCGQESKRIQFQRMSPRL
jgi:hypothetical protein